MIIINDLLSTLGAYLKTSKAFGLMYFREAYQKNLKIKTTKSVKQVNYLKKLQNSFQNSFEN